MFFDSHCHLTSDILAAQHNEILQRARAASVTQMLNIGDDLDSSTRALQQATAAETFGIEMWATCGVHPQNALNWNDQSALQLNTMLHHPRAVAVGEIGLDFVYDQTHPHHPGATRERQEEVLRAQMQIAGQHDLPVVIHNREADERLLSIVGEFPNVRGVFHCFASSMEIARRVLDAGYCLGFTGMVTFKNAQNVRDVAAFCPLDCLLIETDAPYLAPIPHRGKTNEPSFVPRVAQTVAEIKGLSIEEIGAQTTQNARRLFGLNGFK